MQYKVILEAKLLAPSLDIGWLRLRENGVYSATYGHIDWSCTRAGKYVQKADTNFLEQKIILQSDSIFFEKYLIKNDEYLSPLNSLGYATDSTKWLKIEAHDFSE